MIKIIFFIILSFDFAAETFISISPQSEVHLLTFNLWATSYTLAWLGTSADRHPQSSVFLVSSPCVLSGGPPD